jgi:hypothetical protein
MASETSGAVSNAWIFLAGQEKAMMAAMAMMPSTALKAMVIR